MKVTFRHSDGYVFEVVVRNTDLPLELTAGSVEGALGERMLCEFVQFVGNESAASGTVICVATIVNRPDARIGIGRVVALDGIDQSVAFAQGEVQAAAHGRAAQHVAEEIKVQLARVAGSESLRSDDDVRLVRALVPYNVKIPARGVGNPRTRRWQSPHAAFGIPARGVFLHEAEHPLGLHVAKHVEDHSVGMIKTLGIAFHIGRTEKAERFGIAQDVPAERMAGENQALELVVDELGGLIVVALNLVDDHLLWKAMSSRRSMARGTC